MSDRFISKTGKTRQVQTYISYDLPERAATRKAQGGLGKWKKPKSTVDIEGSAGGRGSLYSSNRQARTKSRSGAFQKVHKNNKLRDRNYSGKPKTGQIGEGE